MSRAWASIVFVLSLCAFVHFLSIAVRAARSPEFQRDLHQLREQRRRRKCLLR
jgi:hypothetical protein